MTTIPSRAVALPTLEYEMRLDGPVCGIDEVGRGAARVHAGGFTVRTETLGVGRGSVPDDHFVEQGNILSGTRACYRLPLCRSLSSSLSMRHRVVVG